MDAGTIRSAQNGDVSIAYRSFGEGELDLLLVAGSGLEFEDRGARELKGVPGEWRLFAVSDGNGRAQ